MPSRKVVTIRRRSRRSQIHKTPGKHYASRQIGVYTANLNTNGSGLAQTNLTAIAFGLSNTQVVTVPFLSGLGISVLDNIRVRCRKAVLTYLPAYGSSTANGAGYGCGSINYTSNPTSNLNSLATIAACQNHKLVLASQKFSLCWRATQNTDKLWVPFNTGSHGEFFPNDVTTAGFTFNVLFNQCANSITIGQILVHLYIDVEVL
jgi:hypothetical protein